MKFRLGILKAKLLGNFPNRIMRFRKDKERERTFMSKEMQSYRLIIGLKHIRSEAEDLK